MRTKKLRGHVLIFKTARRLRVCDKLLSLMRASHYFVSVLFLFLVALVSSFTLRDIAFFHWKGRTGRKSWKQYASPARYFPVPSRAEEPRVYLAEHER